MSATQREVSELDKRYLVLLRENVKRFMANAGAEFDRAGLRLLDVAPQDHEGARPFFPKADIKTLDINPASGADYIADLCAKNSSVIADGIFDLVVCTEVLEHTLNPFQAVDEIGRVLAKGGVAVITVPFNFRIHGPLPDCWRISEHGLRSLFSEARGFKIASLDALEEPERFLMPIHYTLIARKT